MLCFVNVICISGPLPTEIGKLNSLLMFSVSENKLTGTLPTHIGDMTSLTGLSLSTNSFDGE